METSQTRINILEIENEYKAPEFDIFLADDEKTYKLKRIVERLPEPERRIILLYSEMQSQRKVAKALGCSTSLANLKINEIRKKIKYEYYNS